MKFRNLCILLAIAMLVALSLPVSASEHIDLEHMGSLTVNMRYHDEPVKGGNLEIYYVAQIVADGDGYAYRFTDDFAASGHLLGDESPAAAEALADYVRENQLENMDIKDCSEGSVVYSYLPLGLFLIMQPNAANGYLPVKPFLVKIPEGGETGIVYDVDATPKISMEEIVLPPKDPDIPSTGQLNWPVPVMAISGLAVFSIGWALCFVKRKEL